MKYQADGSVQPWLATRWRHSADGKPGGSPCATMWPSPTANRLTPRPRRPNFQAVLANRQRHAWLELANQITDVRALSATELQITLKSAYAPLLARAGPAPPVPLHRPLAVYRCGTARGIKAPDRHRPVAAGKLAAQSARCAGAQ
ncbi:hypothetical protein LNP74_10940 [Klebsiella pneumoniae subsp. pneumoniae]|nr:hypothetical protein [Klebsiella pneumoniae subsp. pneumoniae]